MPNAALPDVFGHAGILAFPSIWHEPFGMPVVEAMGSGLPVIATDGGAFPETVDDGQTGFLVARGDATELANALRTLLRSEERRRSMGTSGFQKAVGEFTWDRVVSDLRYKYLSLLQSRADEFSHAS
jgi:glycosyltransferase involved in cell wall biosynthesis